MRLNDGKYICPFCVSSWDCDGPHIEENDLDSFYERLAYIREDITLVAIEEIEKYEASENLDLSVLKRSIFDKLTKRFLN
jgi:hypothetical protein